MEGGLANQSFLGISNTGWMAISLFVALLLPLVRFIIKRIEIKRLSSQSLNSSILSVKSSLSFYKESPVKERYEAALSKFDRLVVELQEKSLTKNSIKVIELKKELIEIHGADLDSKEILPYINKLESKLEKLL